MGRLLDVFRKNRKTIEQSCHGKVNDIVLKLSEHGVFTENELNKIPSASTYLDVYEIFTRIETDGKYTEFVAVLKEVGLLSVAEIANRALDSNFVTLLTNSSAVVGEECSLVCELTKDHAVRWYKDGKEIFAGGNLRFKHQRLKHKLIFTCVQKEDAGEYVCKCGVARTKCILTVEDLSVIEGLKDVTVNANQNLTLCCKLNANCKNIEWLRNGGGIPYKATTFMTKDDENTYLYKLEIERAKLEYTGEYTCRYLDTKTSCKVKVEELLLGPDMPTTSLLYELGDTRHRLRQNQNETRSTETNLAAAQSTVQDKEYEVTSTEAEIKSCRAQIKKQEEKLRQREAELENKENYISELEKRERILQQHCQELQEKYNDLEEAKNNFDSMQKKMKRLQEEKSELEERVNVLEEYINSGQISAQQREVNDDIRKSLHAIIEEQKRSRCVVS